MSETPGGDTPKNESQPGYWEQQAQQPAQPAPPGYGYGYVPPGPPGYPPYPPYTYGPPVHPESSKALTLGLVAVVGGVVCTLPLFVSPFAWVVGNRVLREIDASGGRLGGRSEAQTGKILGIVGTCLLAAGLLLFVVWLVFVLAIVGGSFGDTGNSNV